MKNIHKIHGNIWIEKYVPFKRYKEKMESALTVNELNFTVFQFYRFHRTFSASILRHIYSKNE